MRPRSSITATAIGIAIGTIGAWVIVTASAAPRTTPLPDDHVVAPSAHAAQRAAEAVVRSPQGTPLLRAERWRAVGHRWHRSAPCVQPCVATIFYRYDSDTLVEAFTTLEGDVLDARITHGQPPIHEDEQVVAHALAERDVRVRRSLGGAPHQHGALAYSLYPDEGVCARHRCATVIFMLDGLERTGRGRQLHVLVDLSDERVLRRDRQRCDAICEVGW